MFQYSVKRALNISWTFENLMTVAVIKSLLECATMQVEKYLPENRVTAFLIITTVRTPNDKIVAF
jgi:hypothetical protein